MGNYDWDQNLMNLKSLGKEQIQGTAASGRGGNLPKGEKNLIGKSKGKTEGSPKSIVGGITFL